jgi:hypothetical protein
VGPLARAFGWSVGLIGLAIALRLSEHGDAVVLELGGFDFALTGRARPPSLQCIGLYLTVRFFPRKAIDS